MLWLFLLEGTAIRTIRNKMPNPSISFTELLFTRNICGLALLGSTELHVYDDASASCRVYDPSIPEGDLIDADGFHAYYSITGAGSGMS